MTNEGLMIKNAQVEDEGVYYCQASVTATGEVKRLEINVQVMSKRDDSRCLNHSRTAL